MRLRQCLAATLLLAVAATAGGCSAEQAAADGAVHAWLKNGVPFATEATLGVHPRQSADFDVYVVNDAGHPVTVTGARLLPMPGHPIGKLAHVALEVGKNRIGANRNWPPSSVELRPILGATLPTGTSALAVGMSAPRPGVYVAAGLLLTYRDRGKAGHAHAWGGGIGCVSRAAGSGVAPPCPRRIVNGTVRAVSNFIHQQ